MTIDILLANPLFLSQNEAERELMTPYFPLGLLYLASYLRERDFGVEIFDGTFAEDDNAFLETLERHQPRVAGLTALQPTREAALALARVAQAFGATVVLGGPDPTRHPETYLVDPAVANLEPLTASGISLASIVAGWLVYDGLCKSPLARNGPLFAGILLLLAGQSWRRDLDVLRQLVGREDRPRVGHLQRGLFGPQRHAFPHPVLGDVDDLDVGSTEQEQAVPVGSDLCYRLCI